MFTHRRSVALIALNHWLKDWPTNQEEADQASKMVKVAGWKWIHCLQSKGFKQWEFEHCTDGDTQYITRLNWRPINSNVNITSNLLIDAIEPDKPWPRN